MDKLPKDDVSEGLFFGNRNERTKYSASKIIEVLRSVYQPDSVVDFGCGVGTWLKEFSDLGTTDIFGMDGAPEAGEHLVIDPGSFKRKDLTKPIQLRKSFDLVISLEVAEHLPKSAAIQHVENLTSAGNLVMFSGAVPGQGGFRHINEQWPSYWVKLFQERDFKCYDFIRPKIWNDKNIYPWYRQNILIFSSPRIDKSVEARMSELPSFGGLDVAHPHFLEWRFHQVMELEYKSRPGLFQRLRSKLIK